MVVEDEVRVEPVNYQKSRASKLERGDVLGQPEVETRGVDVGETGVEGGQTYLEIRRENLCSAAQDGRCSPSAIFPTGPRGNRTLIEVQLLDWVISGRRLIQASFNRPDMLSFLIL